MTAVIQWSETTAISVFLWQLSWNTSFFMRLDVSTRCDYWIHSGCRSDRSDNGWNMTEPVGCSDSIYSLMITAFLERTWVTNDKQLTLAGWWFEPLWKILVSWDDYSQYIPNHQPVGNLGEIKRMRGEEVSSPLTHLGWCRFKQVALIESWLPLNLLNDQYLSVTKRQFLGVPHFQTNSRL